MGRSCTVPCFVREGTEETILRSFKSHRNGMTLRGHKILLFGDFSAEVTQKRRSFSAVCSLLFRRQIRFALLYPAVLKVFHKEDPPTIYHSPEEAMAALDIDTSAAVTSSPKGTPRHSSPAKPRKSPSSDLELLSDTVVPPPKDQRKRRAPKMDK